ncbi:MAG: ATP-binding protein, partial [Thiobacillus sp.]
TAPTPSTTPSRWRNDLPLSTHLFLSAGIAILIGIMVASYMQASAGLDAISQSGISSQHANHLDQLNQLLLDAQSATSGYELTRDPAYLASYRTAAARIRDTLVVVRQNYEDHSATAVELIKHAQGLAARMEVINRQIERGMPLEKDWYDQSTMAMVAYRRQHNAMKIELLNQNLYNVRRSIMSIEYARLTTVLLAIASLMLLVLAISQKQKKQELRVKIQHLLEAKNEQLEGEVRLRTEELTNLATYLTDVRESEKQHLAREMHDELGALLTAAKFDVDWIERSLSAADSNPLVAQRVQRLRQSLTGVITLKRRIINDLRPALLHELGLIEALKALTQEFRQGEEFEVKLNLPEAEPELSDAVSLSLFRIVQEAFTNIRKYAQARHVSVSLHPTPTAIELTIEDDGVGFDPDSPRLARHGLAGIKHRVFTHGGQLDIRSTPRAGVTLRVVLPVGIASVHGFLLRRSDDIVDQQVDV